MYVARIRVSLSLQFPVHVRLKKREILAIRETHVPRTVLSCIAAFQSIGRDNLARARPLDKESGKGLFSKGLAHARLR